MVFAMLAMFFVVATSDRDVRKGGAQTAFSLTRDGHFQIAADEEAARPAQSSRNSSVDAPRKIRALLPFEHVELTKNYTIPYEKHVKSGGWFHKPPKALKMQTAAAPSSFANRTNDWMKLSQMAAGSLASTRSQASVAASDDSEAAGLKPKPTMPPERYKAKPKKWPGRTWDTYQRAYEKLKPLRGGVGNVAATAAAAILGPESCILKILYVFYVMDGEDDYPYIPRGCGDMFDFALNANGCHVPWMLIVGALFIVTGTHASAKD